VNVAEINLLKKAVFTVKFNMPYPDNVNIVCNLTRRYTSIEHHNCT